MVVNPVTVVFLGSERLSLNSPMEMRKLMLSSVRALDAILDCIQRLFQLIIRIVLSSHMIDSLATLIDEVEKKKEIKIWLETSQDQVKEWIRVNDASATVKKLGQSIHLRSLKHGFEVEFENSKLYTFFAYFRTSKIGCFQFPLKFGINKGWTIKGAAMYLGEPPKKSSKMVELIYPHLGLGIVFLGTYNSEDSLINYVYLYPEENVKFCAACAKEFEKSTDKEGNLYDEEKKAHICKCGIVKYCSLKCKKKHYGQHLIFCEEGEL